MRDTASVEADGIKNVQKKPRTAPKPRPGALKRGGLSNYFIFRKIKGGGSDDSNSMSRFY